MDSTISIHLVGRLFVNGRVEWEPEARTEAYSLAWCETFTRHNAALRALGKTVDWQPVCKKVLISAERLLELGQVFDMQASKKVVRHPTRPKVDRHRRRLLMQPLRQAV